MQPIFKTSDYNIDTTGKTLVTEALQELIEKTSNSHGILIIEKGTYLVSSLFLKNNMTLKLEKGAVFFATIEENRYPILPTRVAGIEMPWYVGILNCISCVNVTICGEGMIHGNGPYWWNKYWGVDMHGGMRKIYDEKNLRWACDYDCKRIRNVVVSNSNHIILKDFTSYQSGFWNVHILYSHDVLIDNIKIDSANAFSPSTDGIDIDSSYQVEIKNCNLSCNDDSISIKAGRDADGLRVNKACHNIFIHDCTILAGFGITIGSEVSGGVYDIKIENIRFKGTDCGFRIKSAMPRKGYIRNIQLNHLEMINVKYLFHFFLNWNPNYSICNIPQDYKGEIPEYWKTLVAPVQNIQNTIVEDIHISNVTAFLEKDYMGNSRAFHIEGYEDSPIKNITFQNLNIQCKEFGIINYVENIQFQDFKISCSDRHQSKYDSYDNR